MDVSIIVPLYKGKKYCSRLLKMVNDNMLYNELYMQCKVEVIFVNDYPEEKIILDKTGYLFDIHIVTQGCNMGIHASRVMGIQYAVAEYIIMFDQDDLVEKNWLYCQWNSVKQHSGEYCICNGWNDRFKTLWKVDSFREQVNNLQYFLSERNPIRSPGQVIIKKDAIPREWLENIQKINGADDFLLWILALKTKKKFIINDKYLYFHTPNRTSDSVTSVKMIDSLNETLCILKKLNILNMQENELLEQQIRRLTYLFVSNDNIVLTHNNEKIINLKEYLRVRNISNIYHQWFQLKNRGIGIGDYLKDNGIYKVAIYGLGDLGEDLCEELIKSGIDVLYAIDRAAIDYKNVLRINSIEDYLEKVQLIIVTIADEKMVQILVEKTDNKVMSFWKLLEEIIDKISK